MTTLTLRRACIHDAELLYAWRNHPDTYRWFFNSEPVKWEQHLTWLEDGLADSRHLLFMIEDEGRPVAHVRFILHSGLDAADISVTVAPELRGRGYGSKALCVATQYALCGDGLNLRCVRADIMPGNEASIRSFTNAGYVEEDRCDHHATMYARRA